MMAEMSTPIERTRVTGVFAHVDAGKTTTSEAILYRTGRIHRAGSVDEGTTQLDWMDQERARGITITAAATTCYWRGYRINLIDTPGHIDFSAEVVRSIRVIDGAVIVLCGVEGVETQTETVWMHADHQNLPRLIFINKLDRPGADFERALNSVRQRLTARIASLQWPIGQGKTFIGVVDLIGQQALVWRDGGESPMVEPVPPAMRAVVSAARARLLDTICETDDALLLQHAEGHEPGEETLRQALRRATLAGELVPVVCGSARKMVGIEPLLDAVVEVLPAPTDMPPVVGVVPGTDEVVEWANSPEAPLCMSAFKIVTDPHVGHLAWVRVFSGRLQVGETVYNPRAETRERVGRIYLMHANRRRQVQQAVAGDVVALVGVKSAATGDTLCDPSHPIALEGFTFPEPVISVALTPSSEEERRRLHQCVGRLCSEDPTLTHSFDPETGEEILAGIGELHLEVAVDRLRTEFDIIAQVSPPQVAYRETVCRPAEATGTYKHQSGGHGHFAVVRLRIEPVEHGGGIVFKSVAPASEVPGQFVHAVELGVKEALEKGIVAGYPVTDVCVTLLGGKFHDVDSDTIDFRIAGSMAVRQAVRRARPALLEPVMRVEVGADEEYLGAIVADLGRRRGRVQEVRTQGNKRVVVGEVPLAEARAYATTLRDFTHGRGTFLLEFSRYDPVPDDVAEQIVEQRREEGKVPRR